MRIHALYKGDPADAALLYFTCSIFWHFRSEALYLLPIFYCIV